MKDVEGFNQRTFTPNPWTLTTRWGLAWRWVEVGKGRQKEE